MINRNPSFGIPLRAQHPFESSSTPESVIRTSFGNNQRIHRSRKHSITLHKITQPQICAMETNAFFAACGSVMGVDEPIATWSWDLFGIITAVNTALRIWINHNTQIVALLLNWDAMIPKRKDGPALLQNPSILSACLLLMHPVSQAWATACAPDG